MPPAVRRALSFAFAAAAFSGALSAAADDRYDSALAHARRLDADGNLRAAGEVLDAMGRAYPQDYTVALEAGWLRFRAGELRAAEREYARATALSGGTLESRLGLGWTLVRLGRCGDALAELHLAQTLRPDDARARDGIAACSAPADSRADVELYPGIALTGHAYAGHATKDVAAGVAAGAGVLFVRHVLASATYRGTLVPLPSAGGGGGTKTFAQHEGWAAVGWVAPSFGATAHYGLVYDGTGLYGTSHTLGAALRVSPWGDGNVEASLSFYDDAKVVRIAPSWRIPLGRILSARPGAAVQWLSDEALLAGSLELSAAGSPGSVWIGGKLGAERRPVYLAVPTVFDLPETISGGLWAGGGLALGRGWILSLSYELQRLRDEATGDESGMHLLTLAVARHL